MNKRYTWILFTVVAAVLVVAYAPHKPGELIRTGTYQGMVYVPGGVFSYRSSGSGLGDEIVEAKERTIESFYMDQTEITNKQYREFVNWVRDSIAIERQGLQQYRMGNGYIDWEKVSHPKRGLWTNRSSDPGIQAAWEFFNSTEKDPKLRIWEQFKLDRALLKYTFTSINQRELAEAYKKDPINFDPKALQTLDTVAVYPDLTSWYNDFRYSYNDPYFAKYFTHPAYDDYPVIGVSWQQARAFNHWRTIKEQRKVNLKNGGEQPYSIGEFDLPSAAYWQYAAEGGSGSTEYSGADKLIIGSGQLRANYKSGRGNYLGIEGDVRTSKVRTYFPNEYNLYDMSGNVAEWTSDAYISSPITFSSSLSPNLSQEGNPIKVVKGGSWKDTHDYLKTHKSTMEHADSARSYIGFRSIIIK